ncbi:MAG: TetR/AcrR family transcriptional regulator [Burkholderiaceae bacterium]
MARPRAADHHVQRAAIREHAVAAFARLGYASASMADLANACGISKATLYHYFDSKEVLLFECLDDYTRRLLALTTRFSPENQMQPQMRPNTEAKELLRDLIRELLREYAHSRNYHVSLLHDVKFLQAEQAAQIRHQEKQVVSHVADAIDAAFPGRINKTKRTPTTMALLGMINFTFAWLRPDGPMTYDEFADIAIELWFASLS